MYIIWHKHVRLNMYNWISRDTIRGDRGTRWACIYRNDSYTCVRYAGARVIYIRWIQYSGCIWGIIDISILAFCRFYMTICGAPRLHGSFDYDSRIYVHTHIYAYVYYVVCRPLRGTLHMPARAGLDNDIKQS